MVDAGPGEDRVTLGSGNDRVVGGSGRDVISTGAGNDTIDVDDGQRDVVRCGPGADAGVADKVDVLKRCEKVTIH